MFTLILLAIYIAIGYFTVVTVCSENDSTTEKFFFGAIWPALVFPAIVKQFRKQ